MSHDYQNLEAGWRRPRDGASGLPVGGSERSSVERLPMNFRRTVTVLETAEGPTLVAGGASDLSAAQIAAARRLGLTPTSPMPGFHAEKEDGNRRGRRAGSDPDERRNVQHHLYRAWGLQALY